MKTEQKKHFAPPFYSSRSVLTRVCSGSKVAGRKDRRTHALELEQEPHQTREITHTQRRGRSRMWLWMTVGPLPCPPPHFCAEGGGARTRCSADSTRREYFKAAESRWSQRRPSVDHSTGVRFLSLSLFALCLVDSVSHAHAVCAVCPYSVLSAPHWHPPAGLPDRPHEHNVCARVRCSGMEWERFYTHGSTQQATEKRKATERTETKRNACAYAHTHGRKVPEGEGWVPGTSAPKQSAVTV